MIVAYHMAVVGDTLIEHHLVGKQAENHVLHMEDVLEPDLHILVHHIHAHSPVEEVLFGNTEPVAHNLDPVAVHNCNFLGKGVDPSQGWGKDQVHEWT